MKPEVKVGMLFVATVGLVLGFAYYLGALNPFSNSHELNVMYNFAGGIEVGSPVRVMGIKVGKVKAIEFRPDMKGPSGEEVKLNVRILVEKDAWSSIRQDSNFYINLAGVIGEKFLEITPGSLDAPLLEPGTYVRGEDPPRIDQLISQGYGLAGKILDMVENNEGDVQNILAQMDSLVTNVNKMLTLVNKTTKNKDISRLLNNAVKLSDDMVYFTGELRSKEAKDTYRLVRELLFRLEDLDEKSIRQFLQKEGIKAKIF